MKLMSYEEMLKMGKEKIDAALAPMRANSAKKRAELEMAKLEERIATLESEVEVLASCPDVDFGKLISKMDDIALVERKHKQFGKILAEMFPTKKA